MEKCPLMAWQVVKGGKSGLEESKILSFGRQLTLLDDKFLG